MRGEHSRQQEFQVRLESSVFTANLAKSPRFVDRRQILTFSVVYVSAVPGVGNPICPFAVDTPIQGPGLDPGLRFCR